MWRNDDFIIFILLKYLQKDFLLWKESFFINQNPRSKITTSKFGYKQGQESALFRTVDFLLKAWQKYVEYVENRAVRLHVMNNWRLRICIVLLAAATLALTVLNGNDCGCLNVAKAGDCRALVKSIDYFFTKTKESLMIIYGCFVIYVLAFQLDCFGLL